MKSVHDFIKSFLFLFLISAIFFYFQDMYILAGIGAASFLLVKILDTDWAFNVLKFSNHNFVISFVTFILIIVNIFFIYQEMQYATLFNKVDDKTKKEYLDYENSLYSAINTCVEYHNYYVDLIANNKVVEDKDIQTIHDICYSSLSNVESKKIPSDLPNQVKQLCAKNKTEIKTIALNLGDYDFKNPQDKVVAQKNLNDALDTITKIRSVLQIKDKNTKTSFIKF